MLSPETDCSLFQRPRFFRDMWKWSDLQVTLLGNPPAWIGLEDQRLSFRPRSRRTPSKMSKIKPRRAAEWSGTPDSNREVS
jgi:hypothetical protein